MEGPLSKWTNMMKGWQLRFFVLDEHTLCLNYYTSKDKVRRDIKRGKIFLKGAIIGIDDTDDSTFTISVDGKTFHFRAADADDRDRWARSLEETIYRPPILSHNEFRPRHNINDLQRKLAEVNGYLSLLEDSMSGMVQQVSLDLDPSESAQLEICNNSMISSLHDCVEEMNKLEFSAGKVTNATGVRAIMPVDGSEVTNNNNTMQPVEESGSESDNSDAFCSADEEFEEADGGAIKQSPIVLESVPSKELLNLQRTAGDIELDEYNKYYSGEETEGDVVIDSSNNSVITHLLSQVRIGMDLTRIPLPTFILEKRSLLEMYAEFLAHPDIFVEIAQRPTPKDRMIAAVRWYLSAFHAGRRGSVAKKPYNPVLGESFKCYFDVPGMNDGEQGSSIVKEGPCPWAKSTSSLVFIAEQVSHHPPISAFYVEHPDSNIEVNASIWTKSKFLGLSIGVHMVGDTVLTLSDHDEEYHITFPNGYGRSILTRPWVELGGKCEISCPQTGFNAEVEFLVKPFYGGSRHLITGSISHVAQSKPFCKLSGEWNNVMYAEFEGKKKEVFVDIHAIPIIKKQCLPISQQGDWESRRLWKHVTKGLFENDVDVASEGKFAIEEHQRDLRREREETGQKHEQTLFHKEGDNWVFNERLRTRKGL